MDKMQVIMIVAGIGGLTSLFVVCYVMFSGRASSKSGSDLRDLMASSGGTTPSNRSKRKDGLDPLDLDVEEFRKQKAKKNEVKTKKEELSQKLFRAGYYSADDRARFTKIRIISLLVCLCVLPGGLFLATKNFQLVVMGTVLGGIIGFAMPISRLEKAIRRREEEVLYFLPLVIEQVSIGVSSALDVGPCLSHIVAMATERDSHNPVTEMFVHVEKLIRSGLNLEDALLEVGEANGMSEVKHAFMFLGQCAKHGGEVSRQLQELADSIMVQRQVQIEGKIASLPVKATGPLATVFAGFFALLFAGLFVRILTAFGS